MAAASESAHQPVMLREVVELMAPRRGGVFLDGTYGAGGHARALLEGGAHRVLAIDRDPDAEARAPAGITLRRQSFSRMEGVLEREGVPSVAGVLLDLGVSSDQLENARRGFSFQRAGPLDMRMSRSGETAAELLDRVDAHELADIFRSYGEEPRASRIARAVLSEHHRDPLRTTVALARTVAGACPPDRHRVHPATRIFQALRIAVNDELGELERGLVAAERALSPGGVLCVISFHSLEDRIVKRFLAGRAAGDGGWRHLPPPPAARPSFEILTRRPLRPGREELARNPRARSARLRAARRTHAPARGEGP